MKINLPQLQLELGGTYWWRKTDSVLVLVKFSEQTLSRIENWQLLMEFVNKTGLFTEAC